MANITLDELKAHLEVTTTGDDDELQIAINDAQKEIENYCKRTFESSTGTRYYKEEDLRFLPVGSQYVPAGSNRPGNFSWDWQQAKPGHTVLALDRDLLSIDTLTNGDGDTITSTGYWLEPRNSTTCYQQIRLRSTEQWVFNTDGEISVAGSWGFTTGPDPTIKRLTKEFASYLYKSRENPVADVTAIPELGQIVIPKGMPAHVKLALDKGGYVKAVRIV